MIVFHKLTAKNFLSFGDNGIEVRLDEAPTTLITGANGAGKSSILEALVYGLFGKSYRGVPLAGLINSVNHKGCEVTVEFTTGSVHYKIVRGQKPGKLEVWKNGDKLNESAELKVSQDFIESEILGVNYSSFTKICIMSTTNYTPFTQMSAGERRSFVETMLSASDFAEMAKLHKAKLSVFKQQYEDTKTQIDLKKAVYLETKANLDRVSALASQETNLQDSKIEELQQRLDGLKTSIAEKASSLLGISRNTLVTESDALNAEILNLKISLSSAEKDIARHRKELTFYSTNSDCPTCGQDIGENTKKHAIETSEQKISELAASELEAMNALGKAQDALNKKSSALQEFDKAMFDLKSLNQAKQELERSIATLKNTAAPLSSNLVEELTEKLSQLRGELKLLAAQYEKLEEQKQVFLIVTDLLKDTGIKSVIIEKFIPILVSYVNKYLTMLGFNVSFAMDSDFKETITTRFANEHTFDNLSMGERLRVSLAITFAWNQIAKIRGKMDCNLIIMDELLDSALDAEGSEDLFELMENIFEGRQIMIISHKQSFHERVHRHIHMEKVNGFSKMIEKDL